MSGLTTFLWSSEDLTADQRDRMGQAILRAIQGDAFRFQTDIPESQPTDPSEVRAAVEILRTAAGRTSEDDRKYATTGWLDATDRWLWEAYLTFMPWSISGDVLDGEGRQIASVDDGIVTTVALTVDQWPSIADVAGPDRLRPWGAVKAEGRADRGRWMKRHPEALVGWLAITLGLLLIPLPGPGWLVVTGGVLLLVAGALVRRLGKGQRN